MTSICCYIHQVSTADSPYSYNIDLRPYFLEWCGRTPDLIARSTSGNHNNHSSSATARLASEEESLRIRQGSSCVPETSDEPNTLHSSVNRTYVWRTFEVQYNLGARAVHHHSNARFRDWHLESSNRFLDVLHYSLEVCSASAAGAVNKKAKVDSCSANCERNKQTTRNASQSAKPNGFRSDVFVLLLENLRTRRPSQYYILLTH